MKRRLKDLAALLLVFIIGGAIVVTSGVVPIRASDGHWAVTQWLLDYASDRSIAFHSWGVVSPRLDEEGMVKLGAAAYESNCRWCHGSPGQLIQPVAQGMTPKPPNLADAAYSFEPAELFYIVKHGIKFAGMPAWPTPHRDEEIWPVVAFLRELPTLNADEYETLLTVDREQSAEEPIDHKVQLIVQQCEVCHGINGSGGINPRVPMLADQSEEYLRLSLQAYRNAERFSGMMQPPASRLSDGEIMKISAYFSDQKRASMRTSADIDLDKWKLGRRLAQYGDRVAKIPSCIDCHGPGPNVGNDAYPQLAGQPAWYIERQLELFKLGKRGGSRNAPLMHPIVDKLNRRQRTALAVYYSYAQRSIQPVTP